MDQDIEG